jgi:hypothetical protein
MRYLQRVQIALISGGKLMAGETFDDTGAPEFHCIAIPKAELVPGTDSVRLYCCFPRAGGMRLEYTVVIPLNALAPMGRMCMMLAAQCRQGELLWIEDLAMQ